VIADFPVVLDANVLANAGVCDLLLKLAETPRLYLPKWSPQILEEVHHAHREKLSPPWPEDLAQSWQKAVMEHFPEALVSGWEALVDACENDPGDRHVLACAIASRADLIVTYNLKHFPADALQKWGIEAKSPDDFLLDLLDLAPVLMTHRLEQIAIRRKTDLESQVIHLGKSVPRFSSCLLSKLQG
jgi:predicted nucleic acid-binding protein